MKIAVLGASGFVGGHLLRFLRAQGLDARAVVRRRPSQPDPDYRVAEACDVYALRDAMNGCDVVVHAALGSDDVITGSAAPVYAAAEAVGIRRLIYMSSGSVHGQSPAPGTDESSPLSARQAFSYNNAKVRAERGLKRLRARGTVELVILRPTIVFGPGSRWVFDFADQLQDGRAYVVDKANGICNSIYVDNLSHAVMLASTRPGIDGETFLLGDAEVVRWRDLFRPIAAAYGVDFDSVPSVSPPPAPRPTWKQRYIGPVMYLTPRAVKDAIKEAARRVRRLVVNSHRSPVTGQSPATSHQSPVTSPQSPHVPPEIAALQRCEWRLPHDKAARMLGYVPPVSFDEGCRRSIEWLQERRERRLAS